MLLPYLLTSSLPVMFLFAVIAIDSAFHAALQRLEICRPRLRGWYSPDLQKWFFWSSEILILESDKCNATVRLEKGSTAQTKSCSDSLFSDWISVTEFQRLNFSDCSGVKLCPLLTNQNWPGGWQSVTWLTSLAPKAQHPWIGKTLEVIL